MSSLSVALIVRDEEKVLARCLETVKDIADEIIIVDTGSTDKTKEIASKYTDKIYDFKWINDFSAARNYSFSKCTKDWILWLDSDDVIRPEDQKKIKEYNFTDKEIVLCKYQYSHDEFGNVECSLERERFIKRSLNLKWEQPIHEYLPIVGHSTVQSDIEIHHYKKAGSSERNLKILEEIIGVVILPAIEVKAEGFLIKSENKKCLEIKANCSKDPRNYYYLAKEYYDFGKINEAIEIFNRYLEMNDWWENVFSAYYTLGLCYSNIGNEEKFKQCIFKSIEIEERRAEPYYALGSYYMDKQQWTRAIHWFEICLNVKRPKELLSSYYPQYYTWMPCLQLCLCHNNIGDIKKAYEYNERVLEYRTSDSRALSNREILSKALKNKKDGEKKRLNLGCGNKFLPNYVNVDIVNIKGVDEIFDLDVIPYSDNSIAAISSEHALEHVSHDRAKNALKEWFRVLEPGGELMLYIPDLEICCDKYLKADNSRSVNWIPEKDWYKMTIFGAQRNENGSDAAHQIHMTGFSKTEIRQMLEEVGFVLDFVENY